MAHFDGRIAALVRAIGSGNDDGLIGSEIAKFKKSTKSGEVVKYAHKLHELESLAPIFYRNPWPKTYADILKVYRLWALPEEKQFLWSAAEVRVFAKEISEFLDFERNFERWLYLGQYEKAREVLEAVHKRFGISLWYFENMIGVMEVSQGVEAQKAFASEIIKRKDASDDLKFFVHFFSLRAERSMTPERYQAHLRARVSTIFDESDRNGQYLAFRLNFYGAVRFNELRAIISLIAIELH